MKNKSIVDKLLDIKRQISEVGIEYLGTQEPFPLSDVGKILKPFIDMDSSVSQAIKKFNSDIIQGSIPKSNTLQS